MDKVFRACETYRGQGASRSSPEQRLRAAQTRLIAVQEDVAIDQAIDDRIFVAENMIRAGLQRAGRQPIDTTFPQCPICLNDLHEDTCVQFTCDHVMHIECFRNFFLRNNELCPVCQERIFVHAVGKANVIRDRDSDADSDADSVGLGATNEEGADDLQRESQDSKAYQA